MYQLRLIVWIILVLVFTNVTGFAQSENCFDYESGIFWVGEVETPGLVSDVAIVGDHAFVCDRMAGLQVLDITKPESPLIVGTVDTPGFASVLTVDGGLAYVGDGDSGLQVIDISRPEDPFIIGSMETPGTLLALEYADGFVYATDASAGVLVINVSNPESPHISGKVETPGAGMDISLSGSHGFVACGAAGLQILDFTNPELPEIIGTVATPGFCMGITIEGDLAYVADGEPGIIVIDVSTPQSPLIVGSADLVGTASNLEVSNGFAMVVSIGTGLQAVDVSNPENPVPAGSAELIGMGKCIDVSGDFAFVAGYGSDLHVVNISGANRPLIIGPVGLMARSAASRGNMAFVVDGDDFNVFDFSEPESPRLLGTAPIYGGYHIALAGDHAYIAYQGLFQVDISDPEHPVDKGSIWPEDPDVGYGAHDIAVAGEFLVTVGPAFVVLDISDPDLPVFRGRLDVTGSNVVASGHYAYMSNSNFGLRVVDFSNPDAPLVVGEIESSGNLYDLALQGNYVYLADYDVGLKVVDVSNPTSPVLVATMATLGSPASVEVVGNYAYVNEWNDFSVIKSYTLVIDISDPENPKITGRIETPGTSQFTQVIGDNILISNLYEGLFVAPRQCDEDSNLEVTIDIKPGDESNTINCNSNSGIISVAVLTSDDFDATTIDHTTVRFGEGGAAEIHAGKFFGRNSFLSRLGRHEKDVDRDGDLDLLFHFAKRDIGISCGDDAIVLTGETYDGRQIEGRDWIRTVPFGQSNLLANIMMRISPNPFNPATVVSFRTEEMQSVRVAVYDIRGSLVSTLANQSYSAGEHQVRWQGEDSAGRSVPSGLYFFRVEMGGQVAMKKAMLVR